MKSLCDQESHKPVFDDIILFNEFSHVLMKEKLLKQKEMTSFSNQKVNISLYALTCMHQSTLKVDDANIVSLDLNIMDDEISASGESDVFIRGRLQIMASFDLKGKPDEKYFRELVGRYNDPIGENDPHYKGTPLFMTSLSAHNHCDKTLIPGDDFPKGAGMIPRGPIEIDNYGKLSLMK